MSSIPQSFFAQYRGIKRLWTLNFGAMAKAYITNSTRNDSRVGVRARMKVSPLPSPDIVRHCRQRLVCSVTRTRLDGGRDETSRTGTFGIAVNQWVGRKRYEKALRLFK